MSSSPRRLTVQTKLVTLGIVLSFGALAVAAYAVVRGSAEPTDAEARLDAIEARLDRLEVTRQEPPMPSEATLVGLSAPSSAVAPHGSPTAGRPASAESSPAAIAAETVEMKEQLQELVDEAVAKKAVQLSQMKDKKPSMDVFAKTLGLSDAQREILEREVVLAQRDIRATLETPTEDGTNLLDELVEVFADGMANPGKNPQRGMEWFGRIMTEQIPGTSETYAMRAERAKDRLRETLRRELSEEQHGLYESWQMDPSEIEDIPGSPWKEIETRVIERAKDLGAEIPEDR